MQMPAKLNARAGQIRGNSRPFSLPLPAIFKANMHAQKFSSNTVALTTLLEPVCAAILASIFFRETVSVQMMLGALVLLGGLALVMAEGQPKPKELILIEELSELTSPESLTKC